MIDLIARSSESNGREAVKMPKFADIRAWEQAELLMQPVFIRVLDNIRKQLEQTTWQSSYQEIPVWLEAVPEETQTQVMELQQRLASASAAEAEAIEEELARLPSPQMSYLLCLKKGDRQITVDIWQLCYQVCFRNYSPVLNAMDQDMIVTVDVSLIDDLGEIDWLRLDEKAKYLIEQIFSSLSPAQPTAEAPADHTEPADGE